MEIALDLKPIVQWTDEAFAAVCQANPDWGFELNVLGELLVVAPVGGDSGWKENFIQAQLWNWDPNYEKGRGFSSQTVFSLPNGAKRVPDAAWVRRDRWEALTSAQQQGYLPLAPDFVIELRSPSDDLEPLRAKMLEYLDNGVRLGWLLNPQDRQVEIYRVGRAVEILEEPAQLFGETVLPGFVFNTRQILT
ncbi:MAG: Uma2 family endonuclease [Cyanobacteria bacterium P01_F01_bin.33]